MNKKVVLITGVSSGIGLELAKEFEGLGFIVFGTSRNPEKSSKEYTGGITLLQLNVNNAGSRKECINQVIEKAGGIDILVNNAGYGQMGPLAEISDEIIHRQFKTNLFGPAALTQLVLPAMIKQKSGMIVNISSISGVMPSAFAGAYCSSKAAMNAWSDTLRMELKPFGIKVITVQPGAIQSNFGKTAAENLAFDKDYSFYAPVADFVNKRANISQEGATTAEEFAVRLVKHLLKKNPKPIIRIGKSSTLYPLMKRWLPATVLDNIIAGKFGLTQLRKTLQS